MVFVPIRLKDRDPYQARYHHWLNATISSGNSNMCWMPWVALGMLYFDNNTLLMNRNFWTSAISSQLPVKLTKMLRHTWIKSTEQVDSRVLKPRKDADVQHHQEDAIAATGPKPRSGGGDLMVLEPCATRVVFVCTLTQAHHFALANNIPQIMPSCSARWIRKIRVPVHQNSVLKSRPPAHHDTDDIAIASGNDITCTGI